jgi:tetratricopeptide (TPR) repeat protein
LDMLSDSISINEGLIKSVTDDIAGHRISDALLHLQKDESDIGDFRIFNLQALCHYILGEFKEAEKYWHTSLALEENSEARDYLTQLQAPDFQSWSKRLDQAKFQMENKNYEEARILLRGLLGEYDGFVNVYQMWGLVSMICGDKDTAYRSWRKGLSIDASNRLLCSYLHSPKIDLPEPAQKTEISPSSHNKKILIGGTVILAAFIVTVQAGGFLSNSLRESITPATEVQVLSTTDRLANDIIFEKRAPIDDFLPNENLLQSGVNPNTGSELELYTRGYQEYLNGNWREAINYLSRATAFGSGGYLNREALYYLALSNLENQDYLTAEVHFRKYLESFPASNYYDESLYFLACSCYYQGKNNEAKEYINRLKELVPYSGYLTAPVSINLLNIG